ncbi:MAG: hypothetical protein ACAH11_00555 [Sphingomonas sp.]
MRFSNTVRIALLGAATLVLMASAAAPDPDVLIEPEVRPIANNGKQFGCELSMELGRRGVTGSSQDRISFALTQFRFTSRSTSRGIKIGYVPVGERDAEAPAEVAFVTPEGDNRAELRGTKLSGSSGYRLLAYDDGPRTRAAFDTLAAKGRLDIAVTLESGVTRTWSLDLGPRRDVRDAWAKCLSEIVPEQD